MFCIPLAFVWVEPQSCKRLGLRPSVYGENIHTFHCHPHIGDVDKYRITRSKWIIWFLTNLIRTKPDFLCVCVVVSYSENSSACLPMLSSHDNWSSLQMPTHSSMIPMAHNSPPGTNSRYANLLFAFLNCSKSHNGYVASQVVKYGQ